MLRPSMNASLKRMCCSQIARRFSSSSAGEIYDAVINGGGMVGLALAACLRANPLTRALKIAVLDREFPPAGIFTPAPFPALRVSTLTLASAELLRSVGSWRHMEPPRCAPFHDMQVWDAGGSGFVRYNAHAVAQGAMAYVAENELILASLAREVRESGVELICPASIVSASLPPYRGGGGAELVSLQLEGGRRLRARLLVGADGASSRVRELSGIRTLGRDYKQRGVVATVSTAGRNHTAWQRFLPTGPLALLPVRGGYSNVVWSTTPQMAQQLEAMSSEEFAAAVNEALTGGPNYPPTGLRGLLGGLGSLPGFAGGSSSGSCSGAAGSMSSAGFVEPPRVVDQVGPSPKSFPLVLRHAGKYVRPRVSLVGDAAHSVHPLAGQGINLGFGDVATLAQAIEDAVESGRDIGDMLMLEEAYEAPRMRANRVMAAALDGMLRLFAPPAGPLAVVRALGLGAINSSPIAKQTIMRYAMFGS